MTDALFRKLAKSNLKRNREMNLPYFAANAIMSAMFFVIVNTFFAQNVANINYEGSLGAMMAFGIIVMSLFTFGYILYLNSFLINRRQKEFGLYAILGLEKRHVGKIIRFESLMLNSLSLLSGIVTGAIFGRLVFMLLMAYIKAAEGSTYNLSVVAVIVTVVYFSGVYLVTTLYNCHKVRTCDPIELLSGEKKKEKKLRGSKIIGTLGFLLLFAAYAFAITVKAGYLAISLFWPCVIVVIIATYMIFASGNDLILRKIKSVESVYYKPKYFVTVSTLIQRLKQNSAGLSNICILSTMAIVTVSLCCSLYFGSEKIITQRNPNDITFTVSTDYSDPLPDKTLVEATARKLAADYGLNVTDMYSYTYIRDICVLRKGEFYFKNVEGEIPEALSNGDNDVYNAVILTEADYNRVCGENLNLNEDELLILTVMPVNETESLNINGKDFKIKAIRGDTAFTTYKNTKETDKIYFVTASFDALFALRSAINPSAINPMIDRDFTVNYTEFDTVTVINIAQSGELRHEYASDLSQTVYDALISSSYEAISLSTSTYSIDENRAENYTLYGGLLFLGLYFAVLFIVNTVIIMYFKQISEGYEDRERFAILQKVGMSDEEVRSTINAQVLVMFFLPLAVAVLHTFAASNIIIKMLEVFQMRDIGTTLAWISIATAAFALVYVFVFRTTTKVYYNIVKHK